MDALDRRGFLRMSLGGVAAASVAAVATSIAFMPQAAEALPLAADKTLKAVNPVEQAQVVVVGPRHRHRHHHRHRRRRWVCWWNRGRRVCGWRHW